MGNTECTQVGTLLLLLAVEPNLTMCLSSCQHLSPHNRVNVDSRLPGFYLFYGLFSRFGFSPSATKQERKNKRQWQ